MAYPRVIIMNPSVIIVVVPFPLNFKRKKEKEENKGSTIIINRIES